jgi:hypothetical protein
MIDRLIYKMFFWVTGISYLIVALMTYLDIPNQGLWPNDGWWVASYVLVGIGSFLAGFFIKKSNKGPKMWLKKFGLYATPSLLAFRGVENILRSGVDGILGAVFLFWAAFIVVWAAYLLRRLPTEQDEWDELEHDFIELKDTVTRLDHG